MESSDASDMDAIVNSDDEQLAKDFQEKKLKPGFYRLKVEEKKRVFQNNVAGMQNKLKQFYIDKNWLERLDLTNEPAPLAPELYLQENKEKEDSLAHDDFKREMLFYRQAQSAILEGIPKLHKLGVKTKRPEDYFAQMAKSDDHMKKVREVLLSKEAMLERREKARKLRELKKYGKQVQQEVAQKRLQEKKQMMEKLKKHKVKNQDDEPFANNKKITKKNVQGKPSNKMQLRKKYKDKKYGYGGQKKRSKYNSAESSADMSSGFKSKKNKTQRANFKKGGGKNMRPGKQRRQKLKNRKKR